MRDIVQGPTASVTDEVAILHPKIQAFLDALAAWRLRKALGQDAADIERVRRSGHAAHDDTDWMGSGQEFQDARGPRTSDTVQAKHLRR